MTPDEQTKQLAKRFHTAVRYQTIGELAHAVEDKIGHNELARRLGIDPAHLTRLKAKHKQQ